MAKGIAGGHLIITNLVVAGSSRWTANDVSALIQPHIGRDSKRQSRQQSRGLPTQQRAT